MDGFPAETSWTLRTEANPAVLLADEGPFSIEFNVEDTVLDLTDETGTCEECYVFTILDAFSDGIFDGGGYDVIFGGTVVSSVRDFAERAQEVRFGPGCTK